MRRGMRSDDYNEYRSILKHYQYYDKKSLSNSEKLIIIIIVLLVLLVIFWYIYDNSLEEY